MKMTSTGTIRRVDDLGRVVIPKDLRKIMMIESGQPIEIFKSDNLIVLRKYESSMANVQKQKVVKELKNIHELSNRKAKEVIDEAIKLLTGSDENES